ncbi:hypothetical protein LEP1GSC083_4851 [Leptospira interrogans serovar Pyrogenes str. L0374]|uniref:Uncharacterized protein n=3 Tax=Leptospira interrogans TaxID=173 RepID=M6ZUB8_LEPIR|nr:hypothetical protein LEP1GSC077_0723 [Leptospira interrogans str. C10069]EKO26374.1 hypothetical protein LEP1GSC104_3023 [Leptospira interrogans str. UI 12621]EMN28179.1 hypothetical protein LEP1GSC083_4851 [Leptospira interrogans serovar Pyrogenes str. L0374]EMN64725.1 hypothetical protein LEP1GSC092_1031 [Leptospira interrogans serovar Pyrogenes str. R168]EMP09681.1 hypothetical protein LEP1GSC124_1645 [Leptospira interrogans serovar Pyrogenes str. 200701872]
MWEFPHSKIVLDHLCDFSNSSQREFSKSMSSYNFKICS